MSDMGILYGLFGLAGALSIGILIHEAVRFTRRVIASLEADDVAVDYGALEGDLSGYVADLNDGRAE